jgi:TolB-like protein
MSDIQPVPANRAVFLSYAHEDAIAARRIAEALRGFGIEVWFDQSELRGGDQWDAKIRSQIKACTLFIPVISQTTQSRDEAYFRLEWKLADDRSHLMAPGKAFIVPVIIDDTSDKVASVPDSFTKAQWTRLPDGEPDPNFIGLIKRLTSLDPLASPATRRIATASPLPAASATPPKRKSVLPIALLGAAIIAGAAAGTAFLMKRDAAASNTSPATPSPIADARPYIAGSVAVLPFKLLPGAEAWKDRADGLHEELLNQLSDMKPLNLASRTSVLQYRDTTENLRVIGRDLGVEFVVEGSVQTVGDEPRLTLQVIEVATDHHVSSRNFDFVADKTLDPEVQQKSFAFELALSIYRSLREHRPPEGESSRHLAAATAKMRADYQRMETAFFQKESAEGYRSLLEVLEQYLEIDPDDSFARGKKTIILNQKFTAGITKDFRDPDSVREVGLALNQAFLVDPDDLNAQEQMGIQLAFRLGRPNEAVDYLRKAVTGAEKSFAAGNVQNTWPYVELADVLYHSGQASAAVAVLEKVSKLPQAGQIDRWRNAYRADRRPAELIALLRSCKGRLSYKDVPTESLDQYLDLCIAETEVGWTGSPEPALRLYARFKDIPNMFPGFTLYLLRFTDHHQEMLETLSKIGAEWDPMEPTAEEATSYRATALRGLGNEALAQSYLRSLLKDIPANDPYAEKKWGEQAYYYAALGDREPALKAIAASRSAMDLQRDFFSYVYAQRQIAFAYAQLGLPAEASAAIDAVLSSPSEYQTGVFLVEEALSPIRYKPEFEAVIRKHADQLKDPAILDTFFARPGA